ncbi:hypothetical protein [Rubrivivax sp. A210]|nr:hypothetical protein [Rubrivivax sp. A210]
MSSATTLAVIVRVQVMAAEAPPDASMMPLAAIISANAEAPGRVIPA